MAIATSVPESTSEIKFERVKFQYLAVLCGNNFFFCIKNTCRKESLIQNSRNICSYFSSVYFCI